MEGTSNNIAMRSKPVLDGVVDPASVDVCDGDGWAPCLSRHCCCEQADRTSTEHQSC